MDMNQIINFEQHPITDAGFRAECKHSIDSKGVLVLPAFITTEAIKAIAKEGEDLRSDVFAQKSEHSVYLSASDPEFSADHPRNRTVVSSKGCLTDDFIPQKSPLRELYNSDQLRGFLCEILGEQALFEYADPLSSINLHFAEKGQELGWHFDNSSFAITLMIQPAVKGGEFEYVENVRDADAGEMNFDGVNDILEGRTKVKTLIADAGTLVVFRGRNSMHRVTPNEDDGTRVLAVLAYNSVPDVSLSTEARMTFYGRTGI